MRLLRLLPLLVLPALFLGATCVTSVDQEGPTGPWVGEVTNNGPEAMSYMNLNAQIFDANGMSLSYWQTQVCPLSLLPGEKGAFELVSQPDYANVPLPLRAQFDSVVQGEIGPGYGTSKDGLLAVIAEKDVAKRYVIAEITNQSPRTYRDLTICAVSRTPDGSVAAVSSNTLFPSVLRPGEKGTVPLFFSAVPAGPVDLFPTGNSDCCGSEVVLDPSLFHVTGTKVVDGPQGRELHVIGEMDNATGQNLGAVTLQAYVEGEPAFLVQSPVGGVDGDVPRGVKAQAAFTLPLQPGDETSVIIQGIQGYPGGDLYPVPVSGAGKTAKGEDFVVSATLTNPTNNWLEADDVTYNLRASDGTLVGTYSEYLQDPYIAPGGTLAVSNVVSPFGSAKTAEVVAYAFVLDQPPPIMTPPS